MSDFSQIAESFRRFGVTPSTKDLIALKVATSPAITFDSVKKHLDSAIKGTPVEFSDENIKAVHDMTRIKKVYKLSSFGDEGQKKGKPQLANGNAMGLADVDLQTAVLGTMATRGAT